jgi:hypothetical protein
LVSIPTYAVEGDIVGPDVIYKEADRVLTLSTILPLYSSTLGDVTVLSDTYTGYGDRPGIYTLQLGVEGFPNTKTVDISVRSTIGNVIAVTQTLDEYTIILHKNFLLTQNDIIDILVNVQMISFTSTTEIFILTDTYSDNKEAPGTYLFEFHLANSAGFEEVYVVNLQVNNSEKLLPDIVESTVSLNAVLESILYVVLSLALLVGILYIIRNLSRKARSRKGVFK